MLNKQYLMCKFIPPKLYKRMCLTTRLYGILIRAGRNDPAAPVLARPNFLKVKMKFHFFQIVSNGQKC